MPQYEYGGVSYNDPQKARHARWYSQSVNPDGIAAARAQRNATLEAQDQLWRQHNANSMAMRDAQAAYEWQQKADRENQRMRNRMGISPLEEQLADPYSAAYQTVYEDVEAPTGKVSYKTADDLGAGIQMSIGGTDGSAPAPIGISPLVGRRTRREIRPEYAEAQQQLGMPSTRTLTMDEYRERKNIDAETSKSVKEYINNLAISRDQKQAMWEGYVTKAKLRANDPLRTESLDDVVGDLPGQAESVFGGDSQAAQTPMPTPAPATGAQAQPQAQAREPITLEVSNDQMIKSDPTGSVVRGQDGRIYFLPKGTDSRIDITDRYNG